MHRYARPVVLGLLVVVVAGATALAQGSRFFFGSSQLNVPYDGRFIFVRMSYSDGFAGFGRGGPYWAHDYPDGERNFMRILTTVSNVRAHVDETNVLAFDDPEVFKFPVIYLVEPGYWRMNDEQVETLRDYLVKGGFLIVDDFPVFAWAQFESEMARVFPQGQWIELDSSHPIFHSFFDIDTLALMPAYPNLGDRPIFRAMFQDNDPTKRMYVMANFQQDLSEFWEFEATGDYPISETNEAYQFGINEFIYGLTH
jgi:hypothetical protein